MPGARSELAGRIEALLPHVARPARYTGGEWNSVVKDHGAVDLKVAWTFPDAYEVGMSHLGSQILYAEINRRADTLCERAYAPWPDMEARMRSAGVPLFTLETLSPVREFDVLAFPLLYELTYTNVLQCLDLAGLPLQAGDREAGDPLVIAGGPCAFNPEPLAPFLDCVVLGDGELVIHQLLDLVRDWKAGGGRDRTALLRRLAGLQGCYIPAFYAFSYHPDGTIAGCRPTDPAAPARVQRATLPDLDLVEPPTAPIVPNTDIIFDRAQVEVFRGCTRGCRFCHAGKVTRPVRERSPARVQAAARAILRQTGYSELSLVSLSTADYTDIGGTLNLLAREPLCTGVGVSLPSTRVDAFAVALGDMPAHVRRGSITLAPEGGTARMRRVINKTVSDQDLRGAFQAAFRAGYRAVKLYFILGLPTETDQDLAGIAEKGAWALEVAEAELGRAEARKVRVTVSVSVFVPKPHTPFQFEPQVPLDEIRRRQQYIRRLIRDPRIDYKYHAAGSSLVEALLSLGDRRVAPVVARAYELGARFDGWGECFDLARWQQAMAGTGLDWSRYVHRPKAYAEVMAWDHLFAGVTREWLVLDHTRAMNEQEVADCRWENCDVCGACMAFDVLPTLKAPAGLVQIEDTRTD